MPQIQSVTVYCASSSRVARAYFDAATALGTAIAREGWQLVYGGNCVGPMGALADGARSAGGKVLGITPQLLVDKGIADRKCDELVTTTDMRQRKALMELRGDAFVALPGGLGTFEEVFEIIVGRVLGYHDKPIVFANIDGYYTPLLTMLEHAVAQGFIKPANRQAWHVAADIPAVIDHLRGAGAQRPVDSTAVQTNGVALE